MLDPAARLHLLEVESGPRTTARNGMKPASPVSAAAGCRRVRGKQRAQIPARQYVRMKDSDQPLSD